MGSIKKLWKKVRTTRRKVFRSRMQMETREYQMGEVLEDRSLLAGMGAGEMDMLSMAQMMGVSTDPPPAPSTEPPAFVQRQIFADVVALDQPMEFNRLGAHTLAGMMYALRRDVVHHYATDNPATPLDEMSLNGLTEKESGQSLTAGNVTLRADKRPRPLTLRANVGDMVEIQFQNLLAENRVDGEQPADRHVGIHVAGMQLVEDIGDDGSNVGQNEPLGGSVVPPGGTATYKLFAEYENGYQFLNMGVTAGAQGTGGTTAFGLFGALNVEPWGTEASRSQLTRLEMDLAASAWTGNDTDGWVAVAQPQLDGAGQLRVRTTPDGQPILNYDAQYPTNPAHPFYDAGKCDLPIIRILAPKAGFDAEIVHSDLNAIIAGTAEGLDGIVGTVDDYRIPPQSYAASYWDNDIYDPWDKQDAEIGGQPFREFTNIFHDEVAVRQAFPEFFSDPVLIHTLHSVRDGFMINYGSGGIGSEIIANRLGVGPMWNSAESKYEEFFLSAWTVGDPAMIVDVPANAGLENIGPNDTPHPDDLGPKATKAFFPDDPSNVHHSYLSDRVKFRNMHVGPKEHHIFHLHAHQWQFDPNSEDSSYLDSQAIGPGSDFTYEIAYGGSGNRNKTVGDSIFHCHFYPHFAQGMWELWRVHDTFEFGTVLDADGRPVSGARALPDAEILAGTPIPGLIPLPGLPMAPSPDPKTTVAPYDLDGDVTTGIPTNTDGNDATGVAVDTNGDGTPDLLGVDAGLDSAQIDLDGNGVADIEQRYVLDQTITNPGYPFFIPGVAGHRAPSPPLDVMHDGGLPRHVVTSGPNFALGAVEQVQTRLDFNKVLHTATALQLPEDGTGGELAAMDFHATRFWDTFLPDGTPATATEGFETNGLEPQRGAPYAEPARGDDGAPAGLDANGDVTRIYKGVNVQIDMIMNKEGWHYPQQKVLTLWDDAIDTIEGTRAPEPMVMRLNAGESAEYWHTNLLPSVSEVDDFQVRTPADIIGQHIHLLKFDVTSSDGAANGYNYEDGTFSPDEVRERIKAFNDAVRVTGEPGFTDLDGNQVVLEAAEHPFFPATGPNGENWLGARITVQRWYADPLKRDGFDKGLGTIFTHDHFAPSTWQQMGLYATVVVEPEGATWRDPVLGTSLGRAVDPSLVVGSGLGRHDGGPTSWRADILFADANPITGENMSFREFYLEFADFQGAYQAGGGLLGEISNENGIHAEMIPSFADFKNAINPPVRQEPPQDRLEDLIWFPPVGPGGVPRPHPEAISADDSGTYVVNYRNEPVGLRVYDPQTGQQAAGPAGDLALAFQSRTDRANPNMNVQPDFYPARPGVEPGDPYTPLLRTYQGDRVVIRSQVGAHEEEHNLTIHGLKWLRQPGLGNSGWRNSQFMGISEYFNLEVPILPDVSRRGPQDTDYLYEMGAQTEDLWNGVWGILRSYGQPRVDLLKLPNNQIPETGWTVINEDEFDELSPVDAPVREYNVVAVRAADVLGPDGLVYNDRQVTLVNPDGTTQAAQGLIDPTALMFVLDENLIRDNYGNPIGLQEGTPIEPLVLRANAGDSIKVHLTNNLPTVVPDMPGFSSLPPIIHKDENVNGGIVTFNNNDLTPSSLVGLHPQLVTYNVRTDDGAVVGFNKDNLVQPGDTRTFTWYAGDVRMQPSAESPGCFELVARPVEFGAANLMPPDRIKGSNKGLAASLIIEPQDAQWTTDPGRNTSATVWQDYNGDGLLTLDNPDTTYHNEDERLFREFVTVLQDDINLRYGGHGDIASLAAAVPNIAAEGPGVPEDAQDSGQKAINYGADPIWFRLGIAPNTGFSTVRDNPDIHRAFSNDLVGEDPQTAVFVTDTNGPDQVRFRMLQPGGHARGHVMTVHGHVWQREPYIDGSDRLSTTWHEDPTDLITGVDAVGNMPGHNMISWWDSAQEGVGPSSHFDFVVRPGGRFQVPGDYLLRDQASFGSYQGLWGIFRIEQADPEPPRDPNTAYFYGTDGDDQIVLNGIDLSITINGVRTEWLGPSWELPSVIVDAKAGNDTIYVYGSTADDIFKMYVGAIHAVSDEYNAGAVDVENIYVYAGGGFDEAVMYDSAGDDRFVARADQEDASMEGDGFYHYAQGFDLHTAYATAGGENDQALFYDSAGDDRFVARAHKDDAFMDGSGFSNYAHGFDRYSAYATAGGEQDRALFYDTAGDDRLVTRAENEEVSMDGNGFYNYAQGFERNYAYATAGQNDRALFYDSAGDDRFVARAHQDDAYLESGGFASYAQGFDRNEAYATAGGANDQALFYDSAGDDRFVAHAHTEDAYMDGNGFYNYAQGFDRNFAYATAGGENDQAQFYDSAGDDRFVARAAQADAYMDGNGFDNHAYGFERNEAYATAGGANDRALFYDSAGDDQFVARAAQADAYMDGNGFYNYASGFDLNAAYATAGGENDQALFYDSAGDDRFIAQADKATAYMDGSGFYNYAQGFDRNDAYATAGGENDRAYFYDSVGDDLFVARAYNQDAYMEGDGFYNYAQGFDRNEGHATAGGANDQAVFDDSSGDDLLYLTPTVAVMRGVDFYNYAKGFGRLDVFSVSTEDDDRAYFYDFGNLIINRTEFEVLADYILALEEDWYL